MNSLKSLIDSLNKNEKGYFVKQIGKKDSSYYKLFRLIESSKNHSETFICEQFEGSYIGNNFSFAKNYLQFSILKFLIQYQSKNRDSYFYFASIQLLYNKGLYKECVKMIKQVVKKSRKEDDFISLLRAIEYIKLVRHINADFYDKELIEIVALESEIMSRQQIVSTYQSILAEVTEVRVKFGGLKKSKSVDRIIKIRSHPFLKTKKKIINDYCKSMYHEILFLCGFTLQDHKLSKKHIEPLEEIILSRLHVQNIGIHRKIDLLKQIIRYHILQSNHSKAQGSLKVFRFILENSKELNSSEIIMAFNYFYSFQLDLWISQKKIDETEELIQEVELFLEKNKAQLSSDFHIVLVSNKICFLYIKKEYKQVVELIDFVFINYRNLMRQDIILSTMLTEVAVLFQLKKFDLCERRLEAFNRYLAKNNIQEKILKLFSNYYTDLLGHVDRFILNKQMINELDQLESNRTKLNLGFLISEIKEQL